jgi:hypothetical protein
MHLLIDYYESIGVHISQRQLENKVEPSELRPRRLWILRLFKKLTFQSRRVELGALKQAEELADSAECQ